MHTFWYLSVYAMMRPFHEHNQNPRVMIIKFLVYFVVVLFVFDVPGVASTVFGPFGFILDFRGSIHEWVFRSTLDHYATLVGMLCAYFHPNIEALLRRLNATTQLFKKLMYAACTVLLVAINYAWYVYVYSLDKYAYNKLHPYTFFVPMLSYVLVRNSTSFLRRWHCTLFGYLGKITLETYISQLHIYLIEDAKGVLVIFKGYPLLNFLVNSVVFVAMSHLLFRATVALNAYIFASDPATMWRNITKIVMIVVVGYVSVLLIDFLV